MPMDTFGGSVTHPADTSYNSLTLTADQALVWPDLSESDSDVLARTMDVQAQAAGFAITLPDATQAGQGMDALFTNVGAFSYLIQDNSGATIATVNAGQAIYLYLTNNQSAAGTWRVIQFGVGSSSADASLLAGLGLKAIGTTLNQAYTVVETTSDINIAASDRAKLYAYTGGSHTVSLPTSASVGPDFFFLLKNGGAGTITVTPAGNDAIDGSASLLIQPNDGVILYSAGNSNVWYTVALGRAVQFAFTQLVKNVGGATSDITLSSSEAQNKVITFTGTLVQSINVVVPNTVSVYYVFNNTTGPFSLSVKTANGASVAVTQGSREICVCDGTDVRRGVDNTSATTLFSQGSQTAPSVTFVTSPGSGMYLAAQSQVGITAGGTDVMIFNGVSGGVNKFEANAAQTGQPVLLTVMGSDANASMLFKAKGAGSVFFEDVDFTLRNSADTTKQLGLDLSAISTNVKRTLTMPDASGILVIADATQTLSNKTYQDAVFSGNQPVESQPAPLGNVVTCPAGAVLDFAGPANQVPNGWLLCFGQAVSRTTYARLFAVIGTTFGAGDGSTTFNLPDCQGRVAIGKDDMSGTPAGRITAAGAGINGTILGAAGGDQFSQQHTHAASVTDPGHVHSYQDAGALEGAPPQANANTNTGGTSNTGSANTGISVTISNYGTGQSGNVQPGIVFNKIIKC